jgi:hypothetical protein
MIDTGVRWPARWALPFLVVLLVLGHVCDLPAFGDVASHAAGESHHPDGGHHGGEQALSCEPATATTGSGHPVAAAPIGVSIASRLHDPVAARNAGRFFADPAEPSRRQPLFLLHLSLLI